MQSGRPSLLQFLEALVFFLRLPQALPLLVGDGYAVDVLLAGDAFLLVSVVLDGPVDNDVGEAEDDHQIVDELYLYARVEDYGGTGDLLAEVLCVFLYDYLAEVEEEVQEAVVEGQDQGFALDQVVQVGVLACSHFDADTALVVVEDFLGPEPLVLELLVKPVDLRTQGFRVNILALDELAELFFGDGDVALGVGAEEEDLLQVFRDDVAALDKQELALPEQALGDYLFVLLVGSTQIVQVVFEEQDMLLVVGQFPVGFPRQVFGELRRPNSGVDFDRPPLQFGGADVASGQAVHHELSLGNLSRLIRDIFIGYLLLQLLDLLLQVRMLQRLLNGNAVTLLELQHLLQQIPQQRRNARFWDITDISFYFLEYSYDFGRYPWQFLEDHEVNSDAQRPHISCEGILFLPQDLRAHELHRAGEGSGLLVAIVVVDDLGYPKIGYLDAVLVYEYVLGLDIAMDDVPILQKLQRDYYLGNKPSDDLIRQPVFVLKDEVLEGPLVAVLYKEEERIGAFLGIDVLEYIGVGDFPKEVDLLKQGISSYGAGVDRDLFDSEDRTFIVFAREIVTQVHLRHSPLAQHRGVVDLILGHHQELVLCIRAHPLQTITKQLKEQNLLFVLNRVVVMAQKDGGLSCMLLVSIQLLLKMATFNTYDYDFLLKCLAQGSTIFKSQAIKRLNTLAGADKKQFVNHLRAIMNELESVYRQDKEEINYQSIMLLNEIVTNIQSKEIQNLLYGRHLQLVIPALGHPTRTSLRKAAHTVLLNTVKIYPQFDLLVGIYFNYGLLSEIQLVQQKSINSFQSIFILEVKHFNWSDPQSLRLVEVLIDKIEHENLFVSKAASQCILSMCKFQGIKDVARKLDDQRLRKMKRFLEETFLKMSGDAFVITPNDLEVMLDSASEPHKNDRKNDKEKDNESQESEEDKQQHETHKNHANQRRLEKIKRSIKKEEKKSQKENHIKLFSFLTGQGSLKERTEAMQDLLYKIQVSKTKPQFQSSIKAVFPTLLKMLKDNNPKIVSLTLRILQNCIEWVTSNDSQLNNLISVIVQKLGDQKISIRQNVSKVIKQLANKTNKALWIKQLMDNLKKNTSSVLKDETLHLIHHIYDSSPREEEIAFPTNEIIDQISHYTDDPKTKIKIRTLDCLSVIVFHSKEPEKYNFALKGKMSSVFYQMYLEKIGKLEEQAQKKAQQLQKKMKRETVERVSQESYRTLYRQRRNDAKSQGDNEEENVNVSMQTVKKRVSLLRKPRNLLSTQETISVDNNNNHRNDRSIEDVEIVLPSLYKKTGTKFSSHKKTVDFANKTIEGKSSDYLSKDDLKPLRDPQKEMKNIMFDLKSADWKVQFQATNKLRRLIEFHPDVILGSAGANIHALTLDMLGMVENLRSSVAKNSLICLNEFIVLMGKQIDAQMEIILEKLIKKSADTNVFISSQVQRCLNTLGIHSTVTKILEKLAIYRESKSVTVKQAIVNTLYFMKQNEKIKEKQYGKLAESMAFYLQDGQLEVRSKAKLGIIELSKELGDWYRALRGKINPIYFKSICQLMTKSPNLKKEQQSNSQSNGTNTSLSMSPVKNRITLDQPQEQKTYRSIDRVEAPPPKKKLTKVAQFPDQFNDIQGILQSSNSSDWKKRIQALSKVKELALQYPNEFMQFRSASHFVDTICKQISQPNIKVSINGMNTFTEIFDSLKMIIQNNLGIICNSIFAALSSNKAEIKENAQRCTEKLLSQVQIQVLMQFLCHGILYSLPRSRIFLVNKLTEHLEFIHDEKRQLLYKNVFPLLNKLMEEYKAQLMPHVVLLFDKLYEIMGNAMFGHLAKFKEVRELINK